MPTDADPGRMAPSQVADVQEMLFGWRGTFVATLNATWDAEDAADTDLASFVKSFEHVYCFGPLDIQVCTYQGVRQTTNQLLYFNSIPMLVLQL